MSFLSPWVLAAGALAALGVVALHLLSTRRPPEMPLPTARFVPESEARAVSRTSRPTDVLLMILRVAAVLLLAAGFAQPVLDAPGPRVRSVIAVEWTTGVRDTAALRALVAERMGEGDALLLFDTAARVVDGDDWGTPHVRQARLSPMFVAARDAAARIGRGADSLRLIVVGGLGADGFDAATAALRADWPGRIELVSVPSRVDSVDTPRVELRSPLDDDALRPTLAMLATNAARVRSAAGASALMRATDSPLPAVRGAQALRLVRDSLRAEDLEWAREGSRVLLQWPLLDTSASPVDAASDGRALSELRPDGVALLESAPPLSTPTLVAPLQRLPVDSGRVLARWRDGTAAVTEQPIEGAPNACTRHIGIVIPLSGDITLRPAFQQLLAGLLAPCGGTRLAAAPDSLLAAFAGEGPLAAASAFAAAEASVSPAAPWLLLAALVLLLLEQWLRARPRPREAN